MTPMARVLTTLSHKEPDRVPLFLLLSMHGAREMGVSLKTYFSNSDLVAQGQLRMQKKFSNDCLYAFFYAAIEIQAWGGEIIFREDGPPNSGQPFIQKKEQIRRLAAPAVRDSACLCIVLDSIRKMKQAVGGTIPVIGVVMSPFSVPVMQMGFDHYIELIYEEPELFALLMQHNEAFCIEWANAQLDAGATAICYFDPISSPTMIPPELFRKTGFPTAARVLPQIKGPSAMHFASGRCAAIIPDIYKLPTPMIGVSIEENLAELKEACRGKVSLLGNLNGIRLRKAERTEVSTLVREAIRQAAPGGGFILSDNHGEMPWQVSEDTLLEIADAVQTYGQYPRLCL
ncbi:MAG: methylcobamide--CoM methyltransferase MtbA [Spartobacteria bacterium]|nr:methylcobamide--CoM methyltransferase MtbA [Spartobacteria bacterium]